MAPWYKRNKLHFFDPWGNIFNAIDHGLPLMAPMQPIPFKQEKKRYDAPGSGINQRPGPAVGPALPPEPVDPPPDINLGMDEKTAEQLITTLKSLKNDHGPSSQLYMKPLIPSHYKRTQKRPPLSDPGPWQVTRKATNKVISSTANQAGYDQSFFVASVTDLNAMMDDELKQLGQNNAGDQRIETIDVSSAQGTATNNVVMQYKINYKLMMKNNYAYTVNVMVYYLTCKSDLSSGDTPISDMIAGIDDLYHADSGFENSVMHYPEHSATFLSNFHIDAKKAVKLLPGEQAMFKLSAQGFFSNGELPTASTAYLGKKTRFMLVRTIGDIGHDLAASTECGFTSTKLDTVSFDIRTFRFFNASKQLLYNFKTETLGTADRQVQKDHSMQLDGIAD
jgi:hypothetical protein